MLIRSPAISSASRFICARFDASMVLWLITCTLPPLPAAPARAADWVAVYTRSPPETPTNSVPLSPTHASPRDAERVPGGVAGNRSHRVLPAPFAGGAPPAPAPRRRRLFPRSSACSFSHILSHNYKRPGRSPQGPSATGLLHPAVFLPQTGVSDLCRIQRSKPNPPFDSAFPGQAFKQCHKAPPVQLPAVEIDAGIKPEIGPDAEPVLVPVEQPGSPEASQKVSRPQR